MAPSDTVWALDPHTEVKHSVYDKYLDAWFPIMLNTFDQVTYAEGFAGPGIYAGGQPGSPIRALNRLMNARRRLGDRVAATRVRFVLIEDRADRAQRLATEFDRLFGLKLVNGCYEDPGLTILIRRGRCEVDLPHTLTEAGAWGWPILAVLDSWGGGSTRELLARFARNKSSEVLCTVEPQHFVRNLDPARAARVLAGTDWPAMENLPADRKRSFVVERLTEATRSAGFNHVVHFALRAPTGMELILEFGTTHPCGLEKFKDSLWAADPIHGAGFQDPADPDQVLLPMNFDPDTRPLRRMLLHHLHTVCPDRTATLEQLRSFALEHTIFKTSHAALALDALLRTGEITATPAQDHIRSQTRKSTRITANLGIQTDLFEDPATS